MKFTLFYHSLVSDWSHGTAHFLRGVVSDLLKRGHQVQVFEPADGWSRENLLADHGPHALEQFYAAYPRLESQLYDRENLDLQQIAEASDVIIVHEWNEPWLVNGLGELRNQLQKGSNEDQHFLLLFHDTHHRAVSDPEWIERFNLEYYDGILAFGEVLSEVYRAHGWSHSVWTWHEAADTSVFYPREPNPTYPSGELVWIGNWGEDERTQELNTFLFNPVRDLNMSCDIYGVRFPQETLQKFKKCGIRYCGWLPNFKVPEVFANHAVTVHVPRCYYTENLPGIPTIRPFEAMACGIPLVSAPWQDRETLFTPGEDFLVAKNTAEMRRQLCSLLNDKDYAGALADRALKTIRERHTCAHRVDQLLQITESLGAPVIQPAAIHAIDLLDAPLTGRSAHAYN